MEMYASELWELVVDCIGLVLCGIALLQLLRLRRLSDTRRHVETTTATTMPATDIRQLVNEQGRVMLKEFSDTIRQERERLADILDAG